MNNEQTIYNYMMQIRPLSAEDGGGFEALFPQIARSVVGYGETQQEAADDLLAAIPTFLMGLEENNQRLPSADTPKTWDEFSGKFNVRVPKMLHAKLVRLADDQGVSLNSLVQTILMSGATALEAGLEFGAITAEESEEAAPMRYNWRMPEEKGEPLLRLEDYSIPKERNTDQWKRASGN